MKINIHESIKKINPRCTLGYSIIRNVVVHGASPSLAQELFHLQMEAAKFYNLEELINIPPIIGVRSIYKKVDFNPFRYNASSEEVVRRMLQKKGSDYVNSAVTVNNYCSIKFLVPLGLYDLDKIAGEVSYKLGDRGTFVNIDGNLIATDEKAFLTDAQGAFGNPTLEAAHTKVTLATRNILLVVYADEESKREELSHILDFTKEMILTHNSGTVEAQAIITI
ncbi:MAG: hypothetical protein K0R78_2417 [Pelosinus sp.]|jgi:DNA/RNA-binding domain of Phe-tRNA-synthetase-like protein|nr:hypothetical protein [Pelosinus sp.]